MAQTVKRMPTMWETRVQSLGREDLLEREMATHSSILAWRDRGARRAVVHRVTKSRTRLKQLSAHQRTKGVGSGGDLGSGTPLLQPWGRTPYWPQPCPLFHLSFWVATFCSAPALHFPQLLSRLKWPSTLDSYVLVPRQLCGLWPITALSGLLSIQTQGLLPQILNYLILDNASAC